MSDDPKMLRAMCALLRVDRPLVMEFRQEVAATIERLTRELAQAKQNEAGARLIAVQAIEAGKRELAEVRGNAIEECARWHDAREAELTADANKISSAARRTSKSLDADVHRDSAKAIRALSPSAPAAQSEEPRIIALGDGLYSIGAGRTAEGTRAIRFCRLLHPKPVGESLSIKAADDILDGGVVVTFSNIASMRVLEECLRYSIENFDSSVLEWRLVEDGDALLPAAAADAGVEKKP